MITGRVGRPARLAHHVTIPDNERQPPGFLVAIAFILSLVTGLTFYGVWKNAFVDYDDNTYVYLNSHVNRGLSFEMLDWAFTHFYAFNWHPLTWLSHALDCQLYGLKPAGHHITSLLLHTANVVLLFLGLHRMTGSVWRSAFVAAAFGVHPLRVESVAWVAERKDVLSGFFFMLTIGAYAAYAKPKVSNLKSKAGEKESKVWYCASLALFALGLMSKSMLVTVPFVLLLLDFWPLARIDLAHVRSQAPRLLLEKLPFFALSLASSVTTVLAQNTALMNIQAMPFPARASNAVVAYVAYLGQTFWPEKLAVFYPHPGQIPEAEVALAVIFLFVATTTVLLLAKKHPFAPIGWFWYLGMLVPVIGIVQVGSQAHADRYTYLPSIGIFILIAWGVPDWLIAPESFLALAAKRARQSLMAVAAASVLIALSITAHQQVSVWRNTRALFARATAVTHDNYQALTSLANLDLEQGRIAEATKSLEYVLRIAPKFSEAEYLMGAALQRPHLLAADGPEVRVPRNARLVLSYLDAGRLAEAQAALTELFQTTGPGPDTLLMKAALLQEAGRTDEAKQVFSELLAHQPRFTLDNPTINFELAELYCLQGQVRAALPYYSRAIEMSAQFTNALNNLAWLLATAPDDQVRDGSRAVELAERACQLTGWKHPVLMGTLAAAYAEAGRFDDAVKMAERARSEAEAQKLEPVAARNTELLELYRLGKPYREPK